jgi:hypothetical protein
VKGTNGLRCSLKKKKTTITLQQWGLFVGRYFQKNLSFMINCVTRHILFKSTNILVINNNCLKLSKMKILGFLWEAYPFLNKGHLHIKPGELSDKLYNVFEICKK